MFFKKKLSNSCLYFNEPSLLQSHSSSGTTTAYNQCLLGQSFLTAKLSGKPPPWWWLPTNHTSFPSLHGIAHFPGGGHRQGQFCPNYSLVVRMVNIVLVWCFLPLPKGRLFMERFLFVFNRVIFRPLGNPKWSNFLKWVKCSIYSSFLGVECVLHSHAY